MGASAPLFFGYAMANVPTLSESGWVDSPPEKLDNLLSYFVTSEYSQSNLYYGNIASFPYLIATHSKEPIILQGRVRDALERMLNRYFEATTVNVKVITNPLDEAKLSIKLDIMVTDQGIRFSAGREIQTLNSKFVKIGKINNG